MATPLVIAGIPARNLALYHRIRFSVGDPAAIVEEIGPRGVHRTLILRDIEVDRARRHARADSIHCPADFAPAGGLSGDRETATAEALAECLSRRGIARVRADRTFGLSYHHALASRGIAVEYDADLGVSERRAKDPAEIEHLRRAQRITEEVMGRACRLVAAATAGRDGTLHSEGAPLTSERMQVEIDRWLLERGFDNPGSIVAGGPASSDCHEHGRGALRSGEPTIIDIFPRCKSSLYWGDCTRTVVHGEAPPLLQRMHAAVVEAKRLAIAAVRAGVTGETVHRAALAAIHRHGFASGPRPADASAEWVGMVHGTGHGIGLEVHEPPLLDFKGPPLLAGDAVTIEPGLYGAAIGGVRIEDLVIVTADGCENLGRLPEGLDWRC
jgi:Xaa-Pro aminopeptidase